MELHILEFVVRLSNDAAASIGRNRRLSLRARWDFVKLFHVSDIPYIHRYIKMLTTTGRSYIRSPFFVLHYGFTWIDRPVCIRGSIK